MSFYSRIMGRPSCKERIATATELLSSALARNIEANNRLTATLALSPERPIHYNPLRDRKYTP